MTDAQMVLGKLSAADFLREYWQKKPLLIRQSMPGFHSPIMPEELVTMACDKDVESRLVLEKGLTQPWQLRHGPFTAEDFHTLPDTHWTLLLQEMNKHLSEAAELMARFDFIPSWRIDDIMISFSPPHGSVGPHVDSYDVFLLQAEGRKRWQVASRGHSGSAFLPDLELRILSEFTPEQEWVLEPGDMLYLPPGIAHHGIALDHGQTWSVGLRAPSHADMLSTMLEQAMETLDPEARYRDPDLVPPAHPAEIPAEVLSQVQQLVRTLTDRIDPAVWFGRLVTENRSGLGPEPPATTVTRREFLNGIQRQGPLVRNPATRFAYVRRSAGGATLFVEGEEYELDRPSTFAAPLIAERSTLSWEDIEPGMNNPGLVSTLTELYNRGYLRFANCR